MISAGACYTAVKGLGRGVTAGLTLFVAALSAFSLVQQNQKCATDCLDLQFRWHRLSKRLSHYAARDAYQLVGQGNWDRRGVFSYWCGIPPAARFAEKRR